MIIHYQACLNIYKKDRKYTFVYLYNQTTVAMLQNVPVQRSTVY